MRTRVRAHQNLDVRGACVRRKKGSQLTPSLFLSNRTLAIYIIEYDIFFIADGTTSNTSKDIGACRYVELELNRPLTRCVCALHMIESPFKYVLIHIRKNTDTEKGFCCHVIKLNRLRLF